MLQQRGIQLDAGLTSTEIALAEERVGAQFPADLQALLAAALPVSRGFPNWRRPEDPDLEVQLSGPLEGIKFDIEHNDFWWSSWGARPFVLEEAFDVAEARLATAPRLVPVYGHRYLPSEPLSAGNPVFSVHQTDIIFYGSDLRSYLACEFGGLEWATAVAGERRRIPFWTELVEWASQ